MFRLPFTSLVHFWPAPMFNPGYVHAMGYAHAQKLCGSVAEWLGRWTCDQ